MDFLFFTAADKPLFVRDDAESANWSVEERSLQTLFPYDAGKVIERGQRIGFTDETGTFQAFEVRKVRNYEPDHYQEITAEHIVIAELTDEHYAGSEITNKTPTQVLTTLLSGTLWSVGNVTATNTSSADLGMGSVYQNLRAIETNWNVYIEPRVTFGASGITGRYLDIRPAGGVWRGVRLSVNKNADEVGITVDDTETLTALYGYGKATNGTPLDFSSVTWSATSDHPAKPSGQKYIEDPVATAAYGRNGRARFGYYQNTDISNATVLLEKTWEALKATNKPQVSIDCMVRDLYRLGYADQPIRLHDTAIVDIEPTGQSVQLEIIRLDVDLLDPTATRPTIGAYIPNIIYINRETATHASGGRGGGASGRRGSKTEAEEEFSEFQMELLTNNYEVSLRAYQVDMDDVESILRQAGIQLNAQGVIVYADDNVDMWQSKLNVQADRIGLVVNGTGANASIKAASIVTAINSSGSSVTIDADKVYLNGDTIATSISAVDAKFTNLTTGQTTATRIISNRFDAGILYVDDIGTDSLRRADWYTVSKSGYTDTSTVRLLGDSQLKLDHVHGITITTGTGSDAGKIFITLNSPSNTSGANSGNFNIADTAFYQNGVSAAYTQGANDVTLNSPSWGSTTSGSSNSFSVSAINGQSVSQSVYLSQDSWSNGSKTFYLRTGGYTGTVRARGSVDVGSASNWQISYTAQGETVSVKVADKTFTHTFTS